MGGAPAGPRKSDALSCFLIGGLVPGYAASRAPKNGVQNILTLVWLVDNLHPREPSIGFVGEKPISYCPTAPAEIGRIKSRASTTVGK